MKNENDFTEKEAAESEKEDRKVCRDEDNKMKLKLTCNHTGEEGKFCSNCGSENYWIHSSLIGQSGHTKKYEKIAFKWYEAGVQSEKANQQRYADVKNADEEREQKRISLAPDCRVLYTNNCRGTVVEDMGCDVYLINWDHDTEDKEVYIDDIFPIGHEPERIFAPTIKDGFQKPTFSTPTSAQRFKDDTYPQK